MAQDPIDRANLLQRVLDGIDDLGVVALDPRGRILTWNRGAERITALGEADALGRSFAAVVSGGRATDAPDVGDDSDLLRRALLTGRAEEEWQHAGTDGSPAWTHVVVTPLADERGRPAGFSATLRDATARRHVESQLRESQARYRAVSELTSDYAYAFRVEPDGAVVTEWLTGAFHRITGYSPDEILARGGGFSILHPDDLPLALARVQTLVSGQPDTSEFRIVTRSGDVRWIRESARPFYDDARGRLRVFGAARDITEARRAQEQLRQRETELAQVLRLGTLWEMSAVLAHEINQPLAAIVSYARGCARRIRSGPPPAGDLLDAVESIAGQAIRADEIVRRLQQFVRKRHVRRERVDLDELIRDVARLVAEEASQRKVQIGIRIAPALPVLHADAVQIQQVVINLVRNGFDAMAGIEAPLRTISIETTSPEDGWVEIAVSDAGCGVGAGDVEQFFEPFFTTKTEGLGMGLAISRSIVNAHGGRLWADENPNRGLTFRVRLPVGPVA